MNNKRITDSAKKRKSKKQLAAEEVEIAALHALCRGVRAASMAEINALAKMLEGACGVWELLGRDRLRDYMTEESFWRLRDDLAEVIDRAEDISPIMQHFTLHFRGGKR